MIRYCTHVIVLQCVHTCALERGVKRTTLEDTLGGGRKFCGPIKRNGSTFSHVCASTDGAPYSSSPGSAAACSMLTIVAVGSTAFCEVSASVSSTT
jgi:hypothetical protein